MQKSKSIITLKNALIIFAVTLLYCGVKNFDMTDSSLYVIYLGDFSIGLCSRMLLGSILALFKDSFTVEWVVNFARFFTFVFFIVVAFFSGSAISSAEEKHKKAIMVFTALFIVSPFSVTVFAGDIFGFIDLYCIFVLFITVYFGNNKILIFTLPFIVAAGLFLHDCFITGYLAPCLGVIAYYAIKKYGKKFSAAAVFVSTSVLSAATAVYTVIFAKNTVKMTEEQMLNYLAQKGNCSIEKVSLYYEHFLYLKDSAGLIEPDYSSNIWEFLKYMMIYTFSFFDVTDLIFFIFSIPLVAMIFVIWIKAVKNSGTFMEKVPYILFMLTPVPQLISLLFSNDFTRFLAATVIVQFIYLFICVRQKDKNIQPGLDIYSEKPVCFIIPCFSTLLMNLI